MRNFLLARLPSRLGDHGRYTAWLVAMNPYQTPSEVELPQIEFNPNRLPFLFSVPQLWKVYWFGMILIMSVNGILPIAYIDTYQGSSVVLHAIAPLVATYMIWIGSQAILNEIAITHSGIRIHKFGREIEWAEINHWSIGAYSNVVLTLKSGRKQIIFRTPTSKSRRQVITDSLTYFGISERSGDSAV